MQFEKQDRKSAQRALIVDLDKDRYARKERNTSIAKEGFKIFPVLRIEHAKARLKPGAFELIIVNAPENGQQAAEFCKDVLAAVPDQPIFMVGETGDHRGAKNWTELVEKVRAAFRAEEKADASEREESLIAA